MNIYYAHCQTIYGTEQEKRDVAVLKQLGGYVINPSDEEHQTRMQTYENAMEYFMDLVKTCDILAFRGISPDGSLPAGVAKEVKTADQHQMPVIELPTFAGRRFMTVDQTRTYLCESGQR